MEKSVTKQIDVIGDERYVPIHNEGFVGLIECMGSDESIEQSARVSYSKGTRKVSDTRNLLRYLINHKHTSPAEQASVRFHVKLPIFIARQWVRHRTAKLNEMSLRYSEASDDFYIPSDDYIKKQSKNNKQGRDGDLSPEDLIKFRDILQQNNTDSYNRYKQAVDMGVARELSRVMLPVNLYTEWYWKIDLHNFMHFSKLRMDSHAQMEIRDYASAMFGMVKQKFPILTEAFEDYSLNAVNFSAGEMRMLRSGHSIGDLSRHYESYGLSKREFEEYCNKLNN